MRFQGKFPRNIILFLFLLLGLISWPIFSGTAETQPIVATKYKFDYTAVINDYRNWIPQWMNEEKVLGLSIAVVDNKNIIWTEGFGFTGPDKKYPVTPETLFSTQSISKTFTATAVMMAVQDGLLDLDAPVTTYLPNFKVNSRFEAHPERKITLRHLLNHTAGFTHEAPVGNNYEYKGTFNDHIQSISQTWLRCPVGERFYYSNLGIDLAGYILQVVSGKPYEQYVKEKLLNPLDMTRSTFDLEEIEKQKNRAIGWRNPGENIPVKIPMVPAGGLYTNAVELAKFVQFYLTNGEVSGNKLLGEKYLKTIYTIPFPVKGQIAGYGLGIEKGYFYQTDCYYHEGSGFGFRTNMVWYPKFNLGIIILTNNENTTIHFKISNQLFDRLINLKYKGIISQPAAPKTVDLFNAGSAALQNFTGRYFDRVKAYEINFVNGKLFFDGVPIRFVNKNECLINDRKYRFVLNPDGTPKYIIFVSSGGIFDYNDGPNDKPGPNKKEWQKYVDKYYIKQYGKIAALKTVHLKNGYLYLDNLKLAVEYKPGLFFTTTGEAVDFRGKTPTFANIKLGKSFLF